MVDVADFGINFGQRFVRCPFRRMEARVRRALGHGLGNFLKDGRHQAPIFYWDKFHRYIRILILQVRSR